MVIISPICRLIEGRSKDPTLLAQVDEWFSLELIVTSEAVKGSLWPARCDMGKAIAILNSIVERRRRINEPRFCGYVCGCACAYRSVWSGSCAVQGRK